jgi:Tfp pilus assembly protein FimV
MDRKIKVIIALLAVLFAAPSVFAESKRVEVYSLSQHYWDTQSGETLSGIAAQLLPNNPAMQQKLMNDIISQNPDAFQNNDPNYMQANTRLWLPNRLAKTDSKADPKYTQVESFSWGNIKRPKR